MKKSAALAFFLLPALAFAQSTSPLSITPFLAKIDKFILNPIIVLLFVVALAVFFWGIVQLISNPDDTKGEGKQNILYGIIGMFIMVSAYGIIHIILATFGLPNPPFIF